MALVITGKSLAEIEAALVSMVAECQRHESLAPVVIVTGSNLQRLYLRRKLAQDLGAVGNVRFLTLVDVAGEFLASAQVVVDSFSPEGGQRFLMEDLLAGAEAETAWHRAGSRGIAEAASATVQDLREAGVTPNDVEAALANAQGTELAQLYRRYLEESSSIWDRTKMMQLATTIPREEFALALGAAPIITAGIHDLNDIQLRLIGRIASAHDLTMFIPWSEQSRAFAFSTTLVESLLGMGFEHRALDAAPRAAEIALVSAPEPQSEAEAVVRSILDDVESGVHPAEIAILHHRDAGQDELVESVLSRAGLPSYLASGRAARRASAGKIALRLNDVLFLEPTRASLLELITSSDLSLQWIAPNLSPKPIVWERLSKTLGLVKGWSSFANLLQRATEEFDPDQERDSVEWRHENARELLQVIQAFRAEVAKAGDLRSWTELGEWWVALFSRLAGSEDVSEAAGTIVARVNALSQLDHGGISCSVERFHKATDDAIRRTVMSGGYFQRDGIFLGSVQTARYLRFRRVYLMDCAERVFPPVIRQDPILRDEERKQINAYLGHRALPLRAERVEEERLLFNLVQQAAIERLTVSYSRHTSLSGPPRFPSSLLLEELAERSGSYKGIGVIEQESPEWFSRLPSRVSFYAANDDGSIRALDEFDFRSNILERFQVNGVNAILRLWPGYDRLIRLRAARGQRSFGAYDGIVPADLVASLRLFDSDLSPTALAAFAECPYRFFLRSILKIKTDQEPEDDVQMSPLAKGSLVHRVLERFVEPAVSGAMSWGALLLDPEPQIRALLADEAARLPGGVVGLSLIWERDSAELERSLIAYLRGERDRWEEGWSPVSHERVFERVAIDIGDRELTFGGAIDRIDRKGPEIRVIDYKTGSPRETSDGYRKGGSLQLPLYVYAAASLLGVPVSSVSAEYQFVGPRGEGRSARLAGQDLAADARFTAMLRSMVEGIEGGQFFTWPGKVEFNGPTNCTNCDFKGVCHGEVGVHTLRKQGGSNEVMRSWRLMRGGA
jgi:ATP-dependent helicase/nuclease subunit B